MITDAPGSRMNYVQNDCRHRRRQDSNPANPSDRSRNHPPFEKEEPAAFSSSPPPVQIPKYIGGKSAKYFGDFLKCKTDVLFLMKEKPSREQIRSKISGADIIYVGGGNTLQMMRIWRRLGVDKLLIAAYKKGTVLAGVSAGSICWFDSGHSDSMSFYNPHKWKYINVKGLGLIPGIHCPHYNGRTRGIPRRKNFHESDSQNRRNRNRHRKQLRDRIQRRPDLQGSSLETPCQSLPGLQEERRDR